MLSNPRKERRREKHCKDSIMPRQSFDIREDEQLSIEIRRYPCLYDKSNAGYKEKDRAENAWKEIDISLGIEEGNYFIISIFIS